MAFENATTGTRSPQRQRSVYLTSAIAALGGLLFGYDTGVISGAQLFLIQTFHLSPQQQELAVSCVLIGAMIGAVIAGRVNDMLGRKKTLIALAILFTLGAILTAFSPTFIFFIILRVIVGIGIGSAASVVPVYISEIAPSQIRGKLVIFQQLAITIGIAVSYWIDLLFARYPLGLLPWQPMFAAAAIPGILLFVGMLVSPETPRWYASKGRWEEARRTLDSIKGADTARELAIIHDAIVIDSSQGTLKELFAPRIRMALVVGVGLAALQQFVGINTVIYYAPIIFRSAGVASANAAILATSVVGVVNVLSTLIALMFVDRLGRRVLLISGCIGMIIGLVILGLVFFVPSLHAAGAGFTLAALIIYIISFAFSMGPVFWLLSAEIFPTRLRAVGAATSTFVNWFCNFLVSVTFLSLVAAISAPYTFWLYAVFGFIALVFCLRLVPETKGKKLEEIEAYWMNGQKWVGVAPQPNTIQPQRGD